LNVLSLTFGKFFKTSLIFLSGAFLVQESFYPVAEMVLEFVQLGVQVVYGKMVAIVLSCCTVAAVALLLTLQTALKPNSELHER
jgi:hypothetical protein